jgi:hypothetical protein
VAVVSSIYSISIADLVSELVSSNTTYRALAILLLIGRKIFMHDNSNVSHVPAVHALDFRRFRGEADIPALAAVHEGCREWDQIRQ